MLDPEIFSEKYSTTFTQLHPESFLEEVSDEDREIHCDGEILTGRYFPRGRFNKFNGWGKKNRKKSYETMGKELSDILKRWKDGKINDGGLEELLDKMMSQALKGSFKQQQFVVEKFYGKEVENINLKVEEDINVELNISHKFTKNKDKKDG